MIFIFYHFKSYIFLLYLNSFKGEKEISDEDLRIKILEVNKEKGLYELVLPDVKQEDAGEYRIVASNKYSEESCSCQVTVTSKKLYNFRKKFL